MLFIFQQLVFAVTCEIVNFEVNIMANSAHLNRIHGVININLHFVEMHHRTTALFICNLINQLFGQKSSQPAALLVPRLDASCNPPIIIQCTCCAGEWPASDGANNYFPRVQIRIHQRLNVSAIDRIIGLYKWRKQRDSPVFLSALILRR
jgi:hypothetical protein